MVCVSGRSHLVLCISEHFGEFILRVSRSLSSLSLSSSWLRTRLTIPPTLLLMLCTIHCLRHLPLSHINDATRVDPRFPALSACAVATTKVALPLATDSNVGVAIAGVVVSRTLSARAGRGVRRLPLAVLVAKAFLLRVAATIRRATRPGCSSSWQASNSSWSVWVLRWQCSTRLAPYVLQATVLTRAHGAPWARGTTAVGRASAWYAVRCATLARTTLTTAG